MDVDIRKGMPDPHVGKEEFRKRFFAQFYDPAIDHFIKGGIVRR